LNPEIFERLEHRATEQNNEEFCNLLTAMGSATTFAGGETASVGGIVRTMDVGSSLAVRMLRSHIIDASNMRPGDLIVGFSSTGCATWEFKNNSGIGANGLTNAVHDTLAPHYRQFTEMFPPQMPKGLVFRGKYRLQDGLPGSTFTIGEALLSPTRTYAPLVKKILDKVPRSHIHGMIHCSGGGQTKIMKFGSPRNRYVKDNLFETPAVFKMIQQVSKSSWRDMYRVYNMGHRFEVIVPDMRTAQAIIDLAQSCHIDAQVIGRIERKLGPKAAKLVIDSPHGMFDDYDRN
jgi:phosphoribosylformylglycinamidine cyclo-ligase